MNKRLLSWAIFIFLCFVWGSSFILMKIGYKALLPSQIAALRIFSGGVVFVPFAFFHLSKVARQKIPLIIMAGLFGNLVPAFLFTAAITKMDSSLVGILNSLTPICVIILGIVLFRDKIQSRRIVGVLTGFAGLCLLTLTQKDISLHHLGFSALVILATFSYGMGTNLVSHYLKDINPVHIASISLSVLSVPAFIVLWYSGFFTLDYSGNATTQWSVLASCLLGLVGTSVSTILFYVLVQKAGALFASLVTYGIPFVALMWGVIYGEPVTLMEIICLGIILVGVWLARK
jgi:drug/metabolite transporter (DMT)-like permease